MLSNERKQMEKTTLSINLSGNGPKKMVSERRFKHIDNQGILRNWRMEGRKYVGLCNSKK